MSMAPRTTGGPNRPSHGRRGSFFKIAIRFAWRDFQSTRAKFLLVIVAIAAAVAIVTAVTDLSGTVREALILGARQWLAADIQVRMSRLPDDSRMSALPALRWETTLVSETVGQISAHGTTHVEVAAIKAVDPRHYPFYGAVTVRPRLPLTQLLDETSAIISANLLDRLHAKVGQTIRVSGADYKVTGVVENEPDRFAVMPLALMRVILTREGLERTGLLQRGGSAIHRLLFRLPSDADLDRAEQTIAERFPMDEVIDYKKNAAGVAGIEEQAATYFSFLAFMILTVAALGIGLLMHAHVQQRMDAIAILKLLGGTARQIIQVYFLQIAMISVAGAISGFALGAALERVLSRLLEPYLPFPLSLGMPWRAGIQGVAAGVVVPLLFSSVPLLSIRVASPSLLLRRHFEPIPWARPATFLVVALTIIGSTVAAILSTGANGTLAGFLVLALATGVAAASAGAVLAGGGIRIALRWRGIRLHPAIRYGVANLVRPGSLASVIVIVLGVGVCFVYLAYLIAGSLVSQVLQYSPFHGADLYLLNVGPDQKEGVLNFVRAQPGVRRVDLDPFVVLRIYGVNGTPVGERAKNRRQKTIRRTWFAAIAETQPSSVEVMRGKWWREGDHSALISLSTRAAEAMGAGIGGTLEFSNGPELVRVRVAAIHRGKGPEALRYHLTLSPQAVSRVRVTYNGAVWAPKEGLDRLQTALRNLYPAVMVLNQSDIAAIMQDTAGEVAAVLRVISGFSLTGGAMILGASLFAMRFQREQEISVLKVLGATRPQVAAALGAEFTLLGLLASGVGIGLGGFLAFVLGRYAFDQPLEIFTGWRAAVLTCGVTMLVTNAAGWAAGGSILRQRPSEILRGD